MGITDDEKPGGTSDKASRGGASMEDLVDGATTGDGVGVVVVLPGEGNVTISIVLGPPDDSRVTLVLGIWGVGTTWSDKYVAFQTDFYRLFKNNSF